MRITCLCILPTAEGKKKLEADMKRNRWGKSPELDIKAESGVKLILLGAACQLPPCQNGLFSLLLLVLCLYRALDKRTHSLLLAADLLWVL